jgi:tetratricopeptide (TPR) repeat protein
MTQEGKYVFIIHHFDEKGRDCANHLAEILNLLNIQTMFGEDLLGGRISDEVRKRIESASVVVALLTGDNTSMWLPQEIAWASAHFVPCLVVVEEGVNFDGCIAGDLEQIRFAPGDFPSVIVRIVRQVQILVSLDVDIPKNLPRPSLSDRVRLLILDGREYAKKGLWDQVLRVSDEALQLDPTAMEAGLNKAVALARMGQLISAERLLLRMLDNFTHHEDTLLSKVYYNLMTVEEIRDAGSLNPKSLRKQAKYLEKSVALDHKNVYARASLTLCRVALEELNEATAVLMDSLKHGRKFRRALRRLVNTKGAVGHRLLGQLPDWLYSILFPTDDDNDEDGEPEN